MSVLVQSSCGGAVVYWIELLTLNQTVAGSIPVRTSALLSFSKALYPHCCSPIVLSTQVYKWVPGRMRMRFCVVLFVAILG